MSCIRLDFTNVLADVVGPEHGITEEQLAGLADRSRAALGAVLARRGADLRWLDLPYQKDVVASVLAYADSVRGRFKNVVVLGIGGSALGNRALHSALSGVYHGYQRASAGGSRENHMR